MTDRPISAADQCLRCGKQLQDLGEVELRTGGTSGGWKLLFGEWAELGEDMMKVHVLACPSCRRIELKLPESSS